ncbi:MAG: hypothetical protein IPM56_09185 [Ignavibacteriales bacterium]|nr:MAG: hypothetical protein IPM56_09185 [Ignavibacteriales bacterium]
MSTISKIISGQAAKKNNYPEWNILSQNSVAFFFKSTNTGHLPITQSMPVIFVSK